MVVLRELQEASELVERHSQTLDTHIQAFAGLTQAAVVERRNPVRLEGPYEGPFFSSRQGARMQTTELALEISADKGRPMCR